MRRSRRAGTVRSWPCRSRCRKSFVIPASMCAPRQGFARRRICAASGSAPRNGARPACASCAACCSTTTASNRRICTGSWAGSTVSSSRRSLRSICRGRSGSTFFRPGRRSKTCSRRASSTRCSPCTSQNCSSMGRAASRACFRITRRSRKIIMRAQKSCRSCTRWWCARTCTATIRGWRKASMTRSAPPKRSRSTASTTPTRCASRCRG